MMRELDGYHRAVYGRDKQGNTFLISKESYIPYNAKCQANRTPHLFKNFFHYSYKAFDSFYEGHLNEGICTFGISKKMWLRLWKFHIFRYRPFSLLIWKLKQHIYAPVCKECNTRMVYSRHSHRNKK